MAPATFLSPAPQPGEGAYLSRNGSGIGNGDGIQKRRRNRRKTQSFLKKTAQIEGRAEVGVEATSHTFLLPSREFGKEQLTIAPSSDSHKPVIIESKFLLSPTARNSTKPPQPTPHSFWGSKPGVAYTDQAQNYSAPSADTSPGIDDNMAIPPHLRPRKAPPTFQTSKPAPAIVAPQSTQVDVDASKAKSTDTEAKHDSGLLTPPMTGSTNVDIREKLRQDLGIVVGDPQPASKSSLVQDPSSNEDEKPNANGAISHRTQQTSKKGGKLPSKASNVGRRERKDTKWKPGREGDNGNGDLVRSRGGVHLNARQLRSSRWPKASEMRPDPHRWDTKWEEETAHDSVDSAGADAGYVGGTRKRKDVDSETGFKLVGWDGEWAPAPVDWDARPAFRDHQGAQQIEGWMDVIEQSMVGLTWCVSIDELTAVTGEYGEIAPRYWIPIVIGKQSPQTFWIELVKSNKPAPYDGDTLSGVKPWWEHYEAKDCNILTPIEHPEMAGIDPDENRNERLARENDYGSNSHTENRKRFEIAKRDAEREKRKRAQEKSRKLSKALPDVQNREAIKPTHNIFIRSAKPGDVQRIREIYNYYINFSVCAPESENRTPKDMLQRYHAIVGNKLPFLVACERGQVIKPRRKRRDAEDIIIPDKVIGFAHADDFNDMLGMYRFTAEVELYVDKDYYMKGIAKCLLDKLMAMLDEGYIERGGYDIEGEELEIGAGPSRVIKNVLVNLPYDGDRPARMEWIEKWLTDWIGFKKVGDMLGIGLKDGKNVNLAIFQRTTGVSIDPTNPPITMEYPK